MSDRKIFIIAKIRKLTAKSSGKPFEIFQLRSVDGLLIGDHVNFDVDSYAEGDQVYFDEVVNSRYQIAHVMVKL